MVLRPYQQAAIEALADGRRRAYSRQLIIFATGAGKTITFLEYARLRMAEGKRVLVLAHREDLVTQAKDKAEQMGMRAGIEMGKLRALDTDRLVIGSVASLWNNPVRLGAGFDVIIVDEAHHSVSKKWQTFLDSLDPNFNKEFVGVTATPFRHDKASLMDWWERVAKTVTMVELIDWGFLSDIIVSCLPVRINIPKKAGKLTDEEADALISPVLRDIARYVIDATADRRSVVVFVPLIETSKRFAEMLRDCGATAEHADGTMDRTDIVARHEAGETKYLVNSMVFSEGWDAPWVDAVVPLRPIESSSLYQQIVGRGSRLYPGKVDMLLLDLLWQSKKHYARPTILFSGDPELAYMAAEQCTGKRMNLRGLASKTEDAMRIAREQALARKVKAAEKKKAYRVSFGAFCRQCAVSETTVAASTGPQASDKQRTLLKRFHIDIPNDLTSAVASTLIARLMSRKRGRF